MNDFFFSFISWLYFADQALPCIHIHFMSYLIFLIFLWFNFFIGGGGGVFEWCNIVKIAMQAPKGWYTKGTVCVPSIYTHKSDCVYTVRGSMCLLSWSHTASKHNDYIIGMTVGPITVLSLLFDVKFSTIKLYFVNNWHFLKDLSEKYRVPHMYIHI